ncbi:MAG: transcription antitermination factor NusB [Calditrichia bacterium]
MSIVDFEKLKKDKEIMLSRRQARRFALQVLYCNEFLQEDITSVANRIATSLEHNVDDFARKLILKTYQNYDELDLLILNNLKDRDMERIALLEKVLLRLALSELLYFPDIPIEVTMNEALDLTKEFISNRSSGFINGVLDAVLKDLENKNQIRKDLATRIRPRAKNKAKDFKGIKQ